MDGAFFDHFILADLNLSGEEMQLNTKTIFRSKNGSFYVFVWQHHIFKDITEEGHSKYSRDVTAVFISTYY